MLTWWHHGCGGPFVSTPGRLILAFACLGTLIQPHLSKYKLLLREGKYKEHGNYTGVKGLFGGALPTPDPSRSTRSIIKQLHRGSRFLLCSIELLSLSHFHLGPTR
jgi:hypothetical protein